MVYVRSSHILFLDVRNDIQCFISVVCTLAIANVLVTQHRPLTSHFSKGIGLIVGITAFLPSVMMLLDETKVEHNGLFEEAH